MKKLRMTAIFLAAAMLAILAVSCGSDKAPDDPVNSATGMPETSADTPIADGGVDVSALSDEVREKLGTYALRKLSEMQENDVLANVSFWVNACPTSEVESAVEEEKLRRSEEIRELRAEESALRERIYELSEMSRDELAQLPRDEQPEVLQAKKDALSKRIAAISVYPDDISYDVIRTVNRGKVAEFSDLIGENIDGDDIMYLGGMICITVKSMSAVKMLDVLSSDSVLCVSAVSITPEVVADDALLPGEI